MSYSFTFARFLARCARKVPAPVYTDLVMVQRELNQAKWVAGFNF